MSVLSFKAANKLRASTQLLLKGLAVSLHGLHQDLQKAIDLASKDLDAITLVAIVAAADDRVTIIRTVLKWPSIIK